MCWAMSRISGSPSNDPNVRIYQTHERQTFHTDSCDIVGLLCLKTAKSGGLSALVSSTTIFNEMRRRRPDLLKLLFEPAATDRRGEVPEGQKPYFEIPLFNWHQGYLTRDLPAPVHRFGAALRRRAAAHAGARRGARHARRADQRPGAQHVHGVQAGRRAARAQPHHAARPHRLRGLARAGKRRHLLRLWLAADKARPLPPVFAQRYGSVEVGDRGGIIVRGTKLHAPLEAV